MTDERIDTTQDEVPGVPPLSVGARAEGDEHGGAAGFRDLLLGNAHGEEAAGDAPEQDEPGLPEQAEEVEPPEEVERILWHSNAPWVGSGYGTQSGLFAPRLQRDLGHDVAFSAFFGLKGKRLGWIDPGTGGAFQVYPAAFDNHGNDVLIAHARHWFAGKPGFIIFLSDVWVMRPDIAAQMPMLAWAPVDHDPVIPQTVQWFKKGGAIPVAMSRFGEEQLKAAGLNSVQYVPHGYDPAVFQPAERDEARAAINLPKGKFTVGMVAANLGVPSRKCFWQALKAYSVFSKRHPGETQLYLHTMMEHPLGEDLASMCDMLDIRPYVADPYMLTVGAPPNLVCATVNAFDVLLNPAAGEGFGVPMIEAQACGTPVITADSTACKEVAPASAGNWNVPGQEQWTGFKSVQFTPDIEAIVESLEEAFTESDEDAQVRRVSVWEHAGNYKADDIVQSYWKPTLDAARAEFAWRRKRLKRFQDE